MSEWQSLSHTLAGENVVIDVSSLYVYLGRLVGGDQHFLTLADADVHDLRETSTSREKYVLDSLRHGIRVNRKQVHVRCAEVVSVSRLTDVVD
jgi:hypothetical protein